MSVTQKVSGALVRNFCGDFNARKKENIWKIFDDYNSKIHIKGTFL